MSAKGGGMKVRELYAGFRESFVEIAEATDALHAEVWSHEGDPLLHLWFEDLARFLNSRMDTSDFDAKISGVFKFFDGHWGTGSAEVRACIDNSFVENLFWQVPPTRAKPIWHIMPPRLQDLYVEFHGKPPNIS
ncbi:DUF7674 family protein [Loktanella sp. D2R18]|uniref:DUF7674 family protein n=2 Tax=Rhodobacterales TaxID=204455 RepID=UPI0011BDF2BF|nr:hypothetical protein [Loktanella sp. D2R18]MDO6589541.1 hypothetical protein [Yoonia sp. 1_MG-2023]